MKSFIAANWKMNKTISETREFLRDFIPLVKNVSDVDIVIAPPFTALSAAAEAMKGTNVQLAAQDIFWEEKGAFTGEVAPAMLLDAGCTHVIIGHSERRQYFHEDDAAVNKKVKAAHKAGLGVIFCFGESLDEREAGKTFDVIRREIDKGLEGIGADNLVVAYEPIWAIGTGKTASPETGPGSTCIRQGYPEKTLWQHCGRPPYPLRRERYPGEYQFPDGMPGRKRRPCGRRKPQDRQFAKLVCYK